MDEFLKWRGLKSQGPLFMYTPPQSPIPLRRHSPYISTEQKVTNVTAGLIHECLLFQAEKLKREEFLIQTFFFMYGN